MTAPVSTRATNSATALHHYAGLNFSDLVGSDVIPTNLIRCGMCDFEFFDHRYTDAEMDAIYRGYRGGKYLETRRRWEPWYRSAVNDAYLTGSDAVASRVEFMEGICSKHWPESIDVAIDFGGDGGQFFPRLPMNRRVVIDVSGQAQEDGVEAYRNFEEVGFYADLIMICHVLEHLPDPLQPLLEARNHLTPDGIIYVEVPLDSMTVRSRHLSPEYASYLAKLTKHRRRFIAADLASGMCRQWQRNLPRRGVVKQSEHINYFSDKSLSRLLNRAGLKTLNYVSDPKAKVGGLRLGKLGVVARPR